MASPNLIGRLKYSTFSQGKSIHNYFLFFALIFAIDIASPANKNAKYLSSSLAFYYLCQMRRPRHPVSAELQGLVFNPASSLYEISEDGILYGLPLELTRMLKAYSRAGGRSMGQAPLVASWYKSLDKFTKKMVIRVGKIAEQSQDFYPDPEFD